MKGSRSFERLNILYGYAYFLLGQRRRGPGHSNRPEADGQSEGRDEARRDGDALMIIVRVAGDRRRGTMEFAVGSRRSVMAGSVPGAMASDLAARGGTRIRRIAVRGEPKWIPAPRSGSGTSFAGMTTMGWIPAPDRGRGQASAGMTRSGVLHIVRHSRTLFRHSRALFRHSRTLFRHSRTLFRHSRTLFRHSRGSGNPFRSTNPETRVLKSPGYPVGSVDGGHRLCYRRARPDSRSEATRRAMP